MSSEPSHPYPTRPSTDDTDYPCLVPNRFSLAGYCSVGLVLSLVAALELDQFGLHNVVTYITFPVALHVALEVGGLRGWMRPSLHTDLYEIAGMLVWIGTFAYAVSILDTMRPILLIGSFLTINFSIARRHYSLATRVAFATTLIYMLPNLTGMLLDAKADGVIRDAVFALSFFIASLYTGIVNKAFRSSDTTSRASER